MSLYSITMIMQKQEKTKIKEIKINKLNWESVQKGNGNQDNTNMEASILNKFGSRSPKKRRWMID